MHCAGMKGTIQANNMHNLEFIDYIIFATIIGLTAVLKGMQKVIKPAIFFSLIFQFFVGGLHAQKFSEHQFRFQHITANEYYGIGNVWDIIEDHEGFIWFGTEDGLLKYDGYELTSYKNILNDSTSLSGNFILSILEDSKHNLWVGTLGSGLNLYKRDENRFYRFNHDPEKKGTIPNDRVMSIHEDRSGRLWIGTERGGLALLDSIPSDITSIQFKIINASTESPVQLSGDFIRAPIVEDQQGNIYVAAYNNGVNIISPDLKEIEYLKNIPEDPSSLVENNIYELFVDSQNRLWIGTERNGVDLYIKDENRVVHYAATKEDHTLENNEIETIAEDNFGNIWIGTDNGAGLLQNSSDKIPANDFIIFQHEPQNEFSLLSNSIKNIYVDRNNSVWIASYYGGVNVYNKDNYKFTPIRQKSWIPNSLPSNNVTSFAEDDEGNLWIGTDGGGLTLLRNGIYDLYQNNYEQIQLYNPFTREYQKKIKALKFDHSGNLWVGTWASGVFKYHVQTGKHTYYGLNDPDQNFKAYSVLTIEVDKDENVWVGTLTDGLGVYHPEKDSFTVYTVEEGSSHHFGASRINIIFSDSQNRMWIGGELGGLNLYHRDSDTFETIIYEDILTEKINIISINETRDGKLLIGTLEGLIIYEPTTGSAVKFNELDGLPNHVIHATLEDENGNYWLTTNMGITIFNTMDTSVYSYNSFDGLQGNSFNNKSALITSNGYMLLGGTNGWNGFNPGSISQSVKHFPIVFTKFYMDGEVVNVNTPKSPLTSNISAKAPLKLKHFQNNIGFEIASLEYNFSNLNKYSYILEGFNDNWQNMGTDRKIFFTNLSPNNYLLRIRSTNKDGVWYEMEGPLKISILPAWYQTKWFKAIAVLLILLGVYIVIWLRTKYLIRQKIKLEKIVEDRTLELKSTNIELNSKNKEIQAQNEELAAQNDQIVEQREELELTQEKLKEANQELESKVESRTKNLKSTIKKLDKTVEELDRFVYSASHDLSAPMKSIRGLLEIALKEKDPEKITDCLKHIKLSSNRFEDVIRNLVDYSRNIHFQVKEEEIHLSDKVNKLYEELKYWPEANNLKFYNHIDKDLVIETDANRLDTILRNLINNAFKYADKKKKSYVKVDGEKMEKEWIIRVEDNGIGIEKDNVKNIFKMFYRASEKSTGSGLGLYIVNESLQKINGRMEVDSELHKGTTFTIYLPQNHRNTTK